MKVRTSSNMLTKYKAFSLNSDIASLVIVSMNIAENRTIKTTEIVDEISLIERS
jgi:hypothetical protein